MRIYLLDKNLVDPINLPKWELLAQKAGVTLEAVTPDRWVENFQPLAFRDNHGRGFQIHPKRVAWPGYYNRAFYLDFPWMVRSVRAFRPDILLCFEEPFSAFAAQAMVLHSLACPRADLVFYTWDNQSRGVDFGGRWPFRLVYRWIAGKAYSCASAILTATAEGEDFLRPLVRGMVRKIYFGVSFPHALSREEARSTQRQTLVVGFVGRLLEMKGLDEFVDAIALLPPEVSGVLVGSGPYGETVLRRSHLRGIGDRIQILPAVASEEVGKVFQGLDVLVLPSRTTPSWKEQYGRVLVEAMACGVPVVGSSSGAIPDVIGDAGLVFPEGDANALASCLHRLLEDRPLRLQLGEAGRRRSAQFSSAAFASGMFSLCSEILAFSGRPHQGAKS